MKDIKIDDLASLLQCACKDKFIVDDKGKRLFGQVIVLSVSDGKVTHGICGPDVELIVRKSFKV
jgi:hypothetical protein